MFTEDDVKFVDEYMGAAYELRGPVNFQFHLKERLSGIPIQVINPDRRIPPATVAVDMLIGDTFTLKAVGIDGGVPSASFEYSSSWTANNLNYKITLSFDDAARYLSGFREFVGRAGAGKSRSAGNLKGSKDSAKGKLNINDPIWGTW